MKANELRNKSIDNLKDERRALLRERLSLRMQKGVGTPRPHLFRKVRRTIAIIETILREKAGQS
jgi:large subunit ribosomal protein L29